MSDKWVKNEVIATRYPECVDVLGNVDVDRLTRICLLDLGMFAAEYDEFNGQAEREKMRKLVSSYCTSARRSREAELESEDSGELKLPGFEDVREDHVAFIRDGERIRKKTTECDAEDLDAVIRDYRIRTAALNHAVTFYMSLRQHLKAKEAQTVRDLYAA